MPSATGGTAYLWANGAGPSSVCTGSSVTLTASGGQTYKWSGTNETTQSIVVSPTAATTYTVTVTSDMGCTATKSYVISNINALPNNFTLNNVPSSPFCGEAPINLSINNPNSNYSWSWSTGETTTSIQRTLTSSQTVSVTATRNNGCTRTQAIPITVNPRPEGLILGADISCAGGSTTLTAPLGETYLWSTGATSSSITLQPTTSQSYSVTVSNAGGTCSAVFSKTVAAPAPLSLSHSLTGDNDCIANNVEVIPTVSGGSGSIALGIIRSGELYVGSNLSGLRTGTYVLRAVDERGCLALNEVVIAETPVEITALNLSNLDDCIPGNTQLNISTKGDRLPLVYRLDGVVQAGATITLPREERTYVIEVADAAGCVASETKTYPEHDVLKVELIPIIDCSQSFGGIRLTVAGWNENQVSSSRDGGLTWVQGNLIDHLAPGNYPVAIRNNSNGCILNGATVELESMECPSLIGFTQASITITSPEEIANLPLLVNYPQYFSQEGKVTLRLKGDGFPHFFGLDENSENNQVPNLRAEEGVDRLLTYPAGFIGEDVAAYPLNESAGEYLFPAVYIFTLREVAGSDLKVDPERNTLRVTVRLGPPETVDEEVIAVCDPDECPIAIGEDYGTGYCYSWDGPIASDQVGKAQISVCPSSETIYTQKILDINTFELVKLNTYRIRVGGLKLAIVSNPTNHEICIGEEATLSAYSLADGQLISQSQDIKFQWSTGETTNPIKVKPAKNKNYSVYVTELKSGCVSRAEDYVLVRSKPNVAILPLNPVICKQGETYLSTELKIANPTNGITYTWSNGTSGDKVFVNQPGEYTVTATSNADCVTELKVLVEENTSTKVLNTVGSDFYKLPAKIIPEGTNPAANLELGTGGEIENHTVFNDFKIGKSGSATDTYLINSLGEILGSALFSQVTDKKVLILDKSTACRNAAILEQAKAEIIKHDLGFILFMDADAPDGIIHILGSNFKDRYTPVSSDHGAFVKTRLAYLENKSLLINAGVSLHVVLNSLVDNFTTNYIDLTAGINGIDAVPGIAHPELRGDDPPGCKYDLAAATNFLTPAAVIVTLEQGATPFFGYKEEIADLAQAGALTWFTQNYLAHVGRFWPAGHAGVSEYYFIGYDNVTATPKNTWDLSIFPSSFWHLEEVPIWWGNTNGVDAVKVFQLQYVNQKGNDPEPIRDRPATTGEGDFPVGGDVTKIKKGPLDASIVKSQSYVRFQVETKQPPVLTANQLTLWSIKMGKDYDRTEVLVDNSGEPDLTKGYIVNIPKDELDASKGFYQIYVKFYDNGQVPDYYYFDEFQCKWNLYNEFTDEAIRNAFRLLPVPKTLQAIYDFIKAADEAITDGGHIFFDVAGFVNPAFDIANAVWYFAEGRTTDGVVTIIGAIPGFGDGLIIVKKVVAVVGATGAIIIKLLIRNGDAVGKLIRTIKYFDEAGNAVEVVIDLKKIMEGLGNAAMSEDELNLILQKLQDPAFTGKEAVDILKALENDPGIITRNYDLLANSPLLRTNLEVLFKFEELIGLGQISRSKLQEALAGAFGDILNAAATKGGSHVDDILGILSQSHVDDSYMSELIRRMNDYPNLANDLRENPSWLAYYDEIVQDPGRFWEIYNEGDFGYNSALTKWGSGLLRKLGIEIAGNFERITVGNILKQEFDQGLIAAFETQITLYVGENNVEIVVDYLVKELDGTFRIVDAKYTSKSRDAFDAFNSLTPNQQVAYPMITGNNGSLKITVGASPGKRGTLGLGKEENIGSKLRNVELYVSEANNPNQLGFKTSP